MICVYRIVSTGSTPFYNAFFGRGTGPILLDDLLCNGREARIIDCPRSTSQGIGTYDFCPNGHGEDAGVRCVERKLSWPTFILVEYTCFLEAYVCTYRCQLLKSFLLPHHVSAANGASEDLNKALQE